MWKDVESYPLSEMPKNRKNRVIHEVIHLIHKKRKQIVVYILKNQDKNRTLVLWVYNKVGKIVKKKKKRIDISNVKICRTKGEENCNLSNYRRIVEKCRSILLWLQWRVNS